MGYARGEHPNSKKNLIPIKKGEVLNPRGHSKKVRDRIERRNRLEEFKASNNHEDVEPFTQEEALAWYEYMQSLSMEELMKAFKNPNIPFGALRLMKFLRADFQEGIDRNTDKIERRYYGSKNNVDVSASVDTENTSLSSLGIVFGGKALTEEEEETEEDEQ